MKTLQEIKLNLNNNKNQLFSKYPIRTLAIFGSYARNEQSEKSDVDLIVEFKDKIGIEFIDLADEIENILDSKVDLISRNGIKEKYYQAIKSDLIYV